LTIYDLLYRRYPEIASLKARLYELFVSKWIARRAVVIFTISEFVKNDIEGFLGIERDKIVNIRGAAGGAFKPFYAGVDKGLTRAAGQTLNSPFFVYLGNFRPHKNLPTLLRAFAVLKGLKGVKGVKLVLVGSVDAKGRDRDSRNLLKILKQLKLPDSVILTGRIPDDREVAAILNEAVALVHPSFHEGFGLTVLEAMSCGCPVIAANTTSIPEVVGSAGILVDPHNVDDLVGAMSKILNSNTAQYQSMVQKGLAQAEKFSWERAALKVLSTLRVDRTSPCGG
jgi:glycosyltransferase involved in cell wall biosynthesis